MLIRALTQCFGTLPTALTDRINELQDITRLDALFDLALAATTLEEVQHALA